MMEIDKVGEYCKEQLVGQTCFSSTCITKSSTTEYLESLACPNLRPKQIQDTMLANMTMLKWNQSIDSPLLGAQLCNQVFPGS